MRASRLLSILILLQVRGRVTAHELADAFEVSVRTIYRDIDALSMSGIPVYGEAGPSGGFSLLDGYRTRLTGLAPDEAEALLLIGMPREAAHMGLGSATQRARAKIVAALPERAGTRASRIARAFMLDSTDWYRAARPVPHLGAVARAVLDQVTIALDYQSWTRRLRWSVEPWAVVLKAGNWYLVGQAGGRLRTFNIADVHAVTTGAPCAGPPDDFDLSAWWIAETAAFEARLRPGRARLRVSPLGVQRLRLLGSFAGKAITEAGEPDSEGWVEITLPLESLASAAPMLLGLGPELDVLEPDALRGAMHDLALETARRLGARVIPGTS